VTMADFLKFIGKTENKKVTAVSRASLTGH